MTYNEYINHYKELEKLSERVKFMAEYNVKIYPFRIFYLCGKFSYDEVFDYCIYKKMNKEDAATHAKPISSYNDGCYSRIETDLIIKVPKIEFTAHGISRLVHEALHGVFVLFDKCGMELNHGSQEAYAYFIDDIIESYLQIQEHSIMEYLKKPNLKGVQRYNHG